MKKQQHPVTIAKFLPPIRPIPADTNVLLKNIGRDVHQWPDRTGLRHLMDSGTLRLCAATHVPQEVDEKLDRWMEDRGHDPLVARRIWREHYLPNLWIVDTGTLGMDDPRVRTVLARDPDDAPTAALASVLGVQALSEDTDLVDYGLASGPPWLDVIFAVGYVARGETADFGLALGLSISTQTVASAARAVRSLASTPGGKRAIQSAVVLMAGVLLVGVLVYIFDEEKRRWLTDKAYAAGAILTSVGGAVLEAYDKLGQNRFEGAARLEAAAVSTTRPLSDVVLAVRTLAAERSSLSTKELARRMWGYTHVPASAANYLRDQLSAWPAFVEIAPSEWQFGRRALN